MCCVMHYHRNADAIYFSQLKYHQMGYVPFLPVLILLGCFGFGRDEEELGGVVGWEVKGAIGTVVAP